MRKFFNDAGKFFQPHPDETGKVRHTPLQRAILQHDLKKALSLIEKKSTNLNDGSNGIYPPLHFALRQDCYPVVLALVKAGADVRLPDTSGLTPLHHAMQMGQEAFVLTFLKLGADPNARDGKGRAPLHLVPSSCPQMVDALAGNKANVNALDANDNTPLHYFLDNPAMVERLLTHGADLNIPNKRGESAYMMMLDESRFRHYPKALQKKIVEKANMGAVNPMGETILHFAARLEMEDIFHNVVSSAELSARDLRGNNVLHALVHTQNVQMIEKVLEQAPGIVNEVNNFGSTPMNELLHRGDHLAYGGGIKFMTTALVLLNHKACPDSTDEKGRGLLHHAVVNDRIEFLDEILRRGANPNLADKDRKTALHYAIERRNLRAMDVLLDRGADPDVTDARGWTILDRLAEKGDRDSPMVQRLIVAGGQYQKQLPLHPELMHHPRILDKGRPKGGPRL